MVSRRPFPVYTGPHPGSSWSGTAGPCPTCPATAGSLTAAQQTRSRWPRRPPAGRTGCLPPAARGPGTSVWPRSQCSSHMVQLRAEWTVWSEQDEMEYVVYSSVQFLFFNQWQKNMCMWVLCKQIQHIFVMSSLNSWGENGKIYPLFN